MDTSWIDEYFRRVKPYLYVREKDNLLIKRPNEVQKINASGAKILKALLNGTSISMIFKSINNDSQKTKEIYDFLMAIRASVEGNLNDSHLNEAIISQPYKLGMTRFPVLSELAITYRCNLKCNFCYAGANCTRNPIGNDKELNTKDLCKIIDKIMLDAEAPSISFTGGEPTLRKDLPFLIKHAKALNMRVNLISNGTLISESLANDLVSAGLDSAQISIEGPNARIHDRITGVKGSFNKSIQAVTHFLRFGIHVHTNTTLSRDNCEQIIQLPELVSSLGLKKFSMNLVIPTGSVDVQPEQILNYTHAGKYIDAIIAASKKWNTELMWYSPLPLCIYNTITHGLGNKGCAACDGLLSVAPDGSVLPCASYDTIVGNLHTESFESIWGCTQANWFRQKQFAYEACLHCEHLDVCNGACPLYWRAVGYNEIEIKRTKQKHKNETAK